MAHREGRKCSTMEGTNQRNMKAPVDRRITTAAAPFREPA
jgi:hypothetical protein